MKMVSKIPTVLFITMVFLGCHGPKSNGLNDQASILDLGELPENPLLMVPMTSSINPNEGTMSTLYGNKIAATYAKGNEGIDYPNGAVLYEVTWKQEPDSLWFGANIPKEIISVEQIGFTNGIEPRYTLFKGKPLKKVPSGGKKDRAAYIISQRMAMSP